MLLLQFDLELLQVLRPQLAVAALLRDEVVEVSLLVKLRVLAALREIVDDFLRNDIDLYKLGGDDGRRDGFQVLLLDILRARGSVEVGVVVAFCLIAQDSLLWLARLASSLVEVDRW